MKGDKCQRYIEPKHNTLVGFDLCLGIREGCMLVDSFDCYDTKGS